MEPRYEFPVSRGLVPYYVRDGSVLSRQNRFEYSRCGARDLWICGSTCNLYLLRMYRNPWGDYGIFDCVLNSIAAIQSLDRKAAFYSLSTWVGSNMIHYDPLELTGTASLHDILSLFGRRPDSSGWWYARFVVSWCPRSVLSHWHCAYWKIRPFLTVKFCDDMAGGPCCWDSSCSVFDIQCWLSDCWGCFRRPSSGYVDSSLWYPWLSREKTGLWRLGISKR